MRICPECGERSDAGACPADGCPTVDEELARRPAETAELVGRTFGDRYRVDALLGQGGMGWVFAARHLQMGHPLALKVMRRELLLDFTALRRFRREAQACSRLLHHNTIKVHDFGISADGYPWFVMEYLEGCSLDQELRTRGALPLGRVVRIASQVCRSLQEAHAQGTIHRDLKPANIYLARMPGEVDYVKVLDFGIAKVVEGDGAQPQLTATGLIIGTPAYMSPEQVRGQPIDGRSDLYSLGVVIYEMLTGRVPFAASSAAGILTKHLLEQPPPLRPLLPEEAEVPEVVVQLVELLLEKTPEQRPASAAQVLAILEALSAGGAVGTRLVQDGPSGSAAMPTLLDRTEDAAGASAGGLPARGHLPAARAARAAPPHTPAGPARPRLLLPLGLSLLVLLVASAAVGWWLAASRQGTVAPPAAPHAETGSSSGEEGQPAPAAPGPADRPPAAATPQMAEQEPALSAGEPAAPPASSPTPPPPQPATEEGRGAAAAPAQVELLLDSRPRGARVVEQGKTLGTTPLVLSGLAGAVRQVTLLKPGYRQSRQSIPLGSTDRLELELARLPREPAPAPSLAPAPAPPAKQPAPAPPEPKPILFD